MTPGPLVGGVYLVADSALSLPPNADREVHVTRRPVLVVSGTLTNVDPAWKFVQVAPISSSTSRRTRFCVRLKAGDGGVQKKSWVRVPHVQPLMKSDLGDRSGVLPEDRLTEVMARYLEYLGVTDDSEDQGDGKDVGDDTHA